MSIDIEKYKYERLRDVRFYLRKINYQGIDNLNKIDESGEYIYNAVEDVYGDIDLIFNKTKSYRVVTNKFVCAVRNSYDSLVADGLEFATTKKEIDAAVMKFELKLIEIIRKFKDNILNVFDDVTGYNSGTINTDVSCIRIVVRNRHDVRDLTVDEIHAERELNGLKEIFSFIYVFMCMIKDKSFKESNFRDLLMITDYDEYDDVVEAIRQSSNLTDVRKYLELKKIHNIRDYDLFVKTYEKKMEELARPRCRK